RWHAIQYGTIAEHPVRARGALLGISAGSRAQAHIAGQKIAWPALPSINGRFSGASTCGYVSDIHLPGQLAIKGFCMAFTKRQSMTAILVLGLLSAIGPLSIDMYLPGFEGIAASLDTSVAQVQLSLTSFFIGIAARQLIYGPLLDRFGRKRPLLVGLVIYILASFGCAFIDSADSLVAYRFVQALGSCAGMVASRAMVRDFFPPQEASRVLSLLMLLTW